MNSKTKSSVKSNAKAKAKVSSTKQNEPMEGAGAKADKKSRDVQIERIENQLGKWGKHIEGLTTKRKAGVKPMDDQLKKLVTDLKTKQSLAKKRLGELKATNGDNWNSAKASVDSAYKDCEIAFNRLPR